jgi:hypothetical protein
VDTWRGSALQLVALDQVRAGGLRKRILSNWHSTRLTELIAGRPAPNWKQQRLLLAGVRAQRELPAEGSVAACRLQRLVIDFY